MQCFVLFPTKTHHMQYIYFFFCDFSKCSCLWRTVIPPISKKLLWVALSLDLCPTLVKVTLLQYDTVALHGICFVVTFFLPFSVYLYVSKWRFPPILWVQSLLAHLCMTHQEVLMCNHGGLSPKCSKKHLLIEVSP